MKLSETLTSNRKTEKEPFMDIINKSEVGTRVRQLRLLNNYTQSEFAELLDISVTFLSEIENGKKGLSQETLARICTNLHVTADYILFGTETPKASLLELSNALSVEELETTIHYLTALIDMKKMKP